MSIDLTVESSCEGLIQPVESFPGKWTYNSDPSTGTVYQLSEFTLDPIKTVDIDVANKCGEIVYHIHSFNFDSKGEFLPNQANGGIEKALVADFTLDQTSGLELHIAQTKIRSTGNLIIKLRANFENFPEDTEMFVYQTIGIDIES